MARLFGYAVEPDFDLAKERRQDRVGWALIAATVFSGVYLFAGLPFATEVFQGSIATILLYGASFYADRRKYLRKPWLWKVFLASVPVHALYLLGIFWSDKAFPELMTKAIVFMPVLMVGFGIEALIIDRIADRLKPRKADQSAAQQMNG